MPATLTIFLHQLRFFAYHGLYPEERKTGNDFEVNLSVSYTPPEGIITDLSATINYERLFALLQEQMQLPRGLLETLAMEIAETIHSTFPGIKSLDISITKLHAPITSFTGQVGTRYYKEY